MKANVYKPAPRRLLPMRHRSVTRAVLALAGLAALVVSLAALAVALHPTMAIPR